MVTRQTVLAILDELNAISTFPLQFSASTGLNTALEVMLLVYVYFQTFVVIMCEISLTSY